MHTNRQLAELITSKRVLNTALVRVLQKNTILGNVLYNLQIKKDVKVGFTVFKKEGGENEVQLSELDIRIQSAIYTFYYYGVEEFSLEQLAGMIYGDFEKRHRKEALREIKDSIEKMTQYQIQIDANMQYEKYLRLKKRQAVFEGDLLNVGICHKHGRNGKETVVYKICEPSVLMQYAVELKQIVQIDMRLYEAMPKQINHLKMSMCEKLLHNILLCENPNNHIYKKRQADSKSREMLVFGWDKNRKCYSGVIGAYVKEFDARRIESMYETLKIFLENLQGIDFATDYELAERPWVYQGKNYKKIYLQKKGD